MSILDRIFGGAPASTGGNAGGESTGTGTGDTGGQQQQQAPTGQAPTGQQGQQQQEGGNQEQVSGLDAFKDIWNNDNNQEGQDSDPLSDPSKLFNIDPESIQKAVGQIDFAQSVTPEQMQAITEGGEGAQQAFLESMNSVARQVFSQSMVGSAKLVEQALGRASQSLDSRIDTRFKQSQVRDTVTEANPAFKHPAAQPVVNAIQQQLAAKHPTASAQEISQMAQDYFKEFVDTFQAPERQRQQQESSKGDMDWDAFLSGE